MWVRPLVMLPPTNQARLYARPAALPHNHDAAWRPRERLRFCYVWRFADERRLRSRPSHQGWARGSRDTIDGLWADCLSGSPWRPSRTTLPLVLHRLPHAASTLDLSASRRPSSASGGSSHGFPRCWIRPHLTNRRIYRGYTLVTFLSSHSLLLPFTMQWHPGDPCGRSPRWFLRLAEDGWALSACRGPANDLLRLVVRPRPRAGRGSSPNDTRRRGRSSVGKAGNTADEIVLSAALSGFDARCRGPAYQHSKLQVELWPM